MASCNTQSQAATNVPSFLICLIAGHSYTAKPLVPFSPVCPVIGASPSVCMLISVLLTSAIACTPMLMIVPWPISDTGQDTIGSLTYRTFHTGIHIFLPSHIIVCQQRIEGWLFLVLCVWLKLAVNICGQVPWVSGNCHLFVIWPVGSLPLNQLNGCQSFIKMRPVRRLIWWFLSITFL